MITDRIPYPVITGATLRVNNIVRRIAREHQVWLAAMIDDPDQKEGVLRLRKVCQEVATVNVRRAGALARPLEGLRYLLAGKPPDLRFQFSAELAEKIRDLVAKVGFDVAHIEFGHMGLYLEVLTQELQKRSIWVLHDVDSRKYARLSRLEPKPRRKLRTLLHSQMMRHWEPLYAERFARCITVSEPDRRLLLSANPRLRIDILPNGVDCHLYEPLPDSCSSPNIVFVGNMAYKPNVDAMTYFCSEILPRIRAEVPQGEMWIVGKDPSPEVKRLDGNGVHVTGRVDDVRPYYGRSTVCVVPLRAGGGTRLKILESMALGRPVVSTSIGCEGLEVADGEQIYIADHPEAFANATLRLLRDEALRQRISSKARELVVSCYDWDVIASKLMHVYAEVAG